MSVDMRPDAIRARLQAARPPDLRPENRLHHKVDMSPAGIRMRLEQVSRILRLCRALGHAHIRASDDHGDHGPRAR